MEKGLRKAKIEIQAALKDTHTTLYDARDHPPGDQRGALAALSGCRSTLDFILESLSQALGMNQS